MYWPPHVRALILKLRPPWWIDETSLEDPTEVFTDSDFADESSDHEDEYFSALFEEDWWQ